MGYQLGPYLVQPRIRHGRLTRTGGTLVLSCEGPVASIRTATCSQSRVRKRLRGANRLHHSVFSPDGQKVVYEWGKRDTKLRVLRRLPSEKAKPQGHPRLVSLSKGNCKHRLIAFDCDGEKEDARLLDRRYSLATTSKRTWRFSQAGIGDFLIVLVALIVDS